MLGIVGYKDSAPLRPGTPDILQVKQEIWKLLDKDPRPDFVRRLAGPKLGLHVGEFSCRSRRQEQAHSRGQSPAEHSVEHYRPYELADAYTGRSCCDHLTISSHASEPDEYSN